MPVDPELIKRSLMYRFIYSMTRLIPGLVCMMGGAVLFLNGVAGALALKQRCLQWVSNAHLRRASN